MQAVGNKKICSSCREEKTVSDFHRATKAKDGLQNVCAACKATMLRHRRHNLANGSIDKMTEAQGGKCAICMRPTLELVLDHCHRTGAIRGMLCRPCNALLGMCDDSLEVLQNAMAYLTKDTKQC